MRKKRTTVITVVEREVVVKAPRTCKVCGSPIDPVALESPLPIEAGRPSECDSNSTALSKALRPTVQSQERNS